MPELLAAERRTADLHARRRTTSPTASFSSSASTRRRRTRATPTCRASGRSIDELPELAGRPILVMKSTVPVGTGEKVRAGLDQRGLDHVGYASNPEFLAEGRAVRDFMNPDRIVDRRVRRRGRRRGRRALRGDRRADRPRRRELGRDDQARRERLPDDAHLVHQRDRERLRGDRRGRRRRSPRASGSTSRLGPHFLRAGIGYGGSCFPKDSLALKQLASNSGYHFQLLSAVIEVNELQKRRVIGKLKRHLGPLRGKTVALLGLAFKAGHRRHARGAVDRARLAPARRRRRGARVGPGRRRHEAAEGRRGRRRPCSTAVRGADAAVIVTEWAELRGPRVGRGARGDGEPADRRRAQPARPGGDTPRRLRLRRHRPPDLAVATCCRRRPSRAAHEA